MSLNIPDHYVISFSTNIELLLQQKGSKLRATVTEMRYVGKQAAVVDQIGAVEMSQVTSRFAPITYTDAAVDRRWVYPTDFDLAQRIDSFDKLRLLTDPESSYTQNAVLAAGRRIDRVIIPAFMGTAKTGEQGQTSTPFASANEVDVAVGGANSRLNVKKLLEVKEKMLANYIDFDIEEAYVGLTAKDNTSLLNEIQMVSSEFNGQDRPVLKEGVVDTFLRLKFIPCELIETVAAGTNEVNVPVWVKSGMHLGIWEDIQNTISRRMDLKGHPYQIYTQATFGATRTQEAKVYNIESYRA